MNTSTTPKDFFVHLGATIALYVATISLINLSFAIINYLVPDTLASSFYAPSVAWPISILIVLVPVLYILEWVITKDIRLVPEKAGIFIRRWRVYLTLFIAGSIIIGDVISLINTYLSGEITMRFFSKIIIIFVICGVIFAYYLLQRTDTNGNKKTARTVLGLVGILITMVAVVSGFIVVGSPWTQRALRFDEQRVNDLTNIQWQILSYWNVTSKLPASLADLDDFAYGDVIPSDPVTKAPYGYSIKLESSKSPFTFELCATFDLPSRNTTGKGAYTRGGYAVSSMTTNSSFDRISDANDLWKHDSGYMCFERNIDPAKHPQSSK